MKNITLNHWALFLMVFLAFLLGVFIIIFSYIFGVKKPKKEKLTPYESGMPLLDESRKKLSIKYFIVGLLFLIFDVEIVFLYPLAILEDNLNEFVLIEIIIFLIMVLFTYIYLLKERAFKWED